MDDFRLAFTFPDDLREVYRGFGLDLSHLGWRLPLPATYVIGQDGLVVHRSVDPDYTTRPEPDELIEVLRAL